jgi:hypothetical protein
MKVITSIVFIFFSLSIIGQVNNTMPENSIAEEKKLDSSINKLYFANFLVESDTGICKVYLNSNLGWVNEKSLDYTVTNLNTNKKVFYKQVPVLSTKKSGLDSLILMDCNFDSFTDFYLQSEVQGQSKYFVYDQAKDTFISEKLLNSFDVIYFDLNNKTVVGRNIHPQCYRDKLGVTHTSNKTYVEEYSIHGIGLENVAVTSFLTINNKKKNRLIHRKKHYYKYINQRLIPQ